MNLLLDTHIILWWLSDASKLTLDHRNLLIDINSICYISAVSIWEINIKSAIGKLTIPENYLDILKKQGFLELPITWGHSHTVMQLPAFHSDPFDRMLIAQAKVEDLTLLTVDDCIKKYNIKVR